MNPSDVKKKLAGLWKETFNDSTQYVSLIFDNYFNPDLCAIEEIGGDVVAGLVGIPYCFGNSDNSIKALYLCGLATKPQFRSRGIMTRLLTEINEKARQNGFAFTFLIPADSGLRKYYRDRDYVNGFYRVIDNYTSLHDFDREYESILAEQKEKVADLKRRLYNSLKTAVLTGDGPETYPAREGIRDLIRSLEDAQEDLQIIHSDRDISVILDENRISGGEIHYVYNASSANITAAAFTTVADGAVNIHKLFASDLASKYKVLASVKTTHPDLAIRHYIPSIEMDRAALWMRTYGSFMKEAKQAGAVSITERVYSLAAHAKVYGMVKILDFLEILKFQAAGRHDLKYSILAKSDDVYTVEKIDVRDGNLKIKKIPVDSSSPSQHTHVMSKRDIAEILFRRRDTDNLITEAFGIPSINGAISLMLD